ncbi:MAG: hypothetical protein OCC45_06275 [Desulfotalea sp.]
MSVRYKVVFTGQLDSKIEKTQIISNLSKKLKISEEKAEHFISSEKTKAIKKDLSKENALKYQRLLSNAGLQIDIQIDNTDNLNTSLVKEKYNETTTDNVSQETKNWKGSPSRIDHKTPNKKESKSNLTLSIILVILVSVLAYFVYLQYQKHSIDVEFNRVLRVNTMESYNNFIQKNKNTKDSADMAYYRDKKAFTNAKKINSLESYQSFLDSYPGSSWQNNVVYYRDKSALDRAKKIETLEAIISFLKNYPNSAWLPQGNYVLRHTYGFNNVSEAEIYLMNKE